MAERPLECSQCKKQVAVHYTEMVEGKATEQVMCSECPVLQRKLHGSSQKATEAKTHPETGICCGSCGTTLEAVQTGNPVGCAECYDVFQDAINFELSTAGRLSKFVDRGRKTLHTGRAPGETLELSPEIRLIALNEALTETLTKEDYEQAAWLRDQIKQLKGEIDEGE